MIERYPGHIPSGNLLYSYWKLPFIVDLPIENCDVPQLCYSYVSLPEGMFFVIVLRVNINGPGRCWEVWGKAHEKT